MSMKERIPIEDIEAGDAVYVDNQWAFLCVKQITPLAIGKFAITFEAMKGGREVEVTKVYSKSKTFQLYE